MSKWRGRSRISRAAFLKIFANHPALQYTEGKFFASLVVSAGKKKKKKKSLIIYLAWTFSKFIRNSRNDLPENFAAVIIILSSIVTFPYFSCCCFTRKLTMRQSSCNRRELNETNLDQISASRLRPKKKSNDSFLNP